VFLASLEFGGAASATDTGGATYVSAAAFYWVLLAGVLVLRWAWSDQRKRCPRCLRRLELAVRIRERSRALLEPGGTEMACLQGHGFLFTADADSSAANDRWYPLDPSWHGMFAPAVKTSR